MVRLFVCLILLLPMSVSVWARKKVPADVDPVFFHGVRITALHEGVVHGRAQNGGYIQAWDVVTGERLWERQVYDSGRIRRRSFLESDIYITDLDIKDGALYVRNEQEDLFVFVLSHPDNALDSHLDRPMRVAGTALNVRQGAVVRTGTSIIFVDGLGSWPYGFEGNGVIVHGVLVKDTAAVDERESDTPLDVAGYTYRLVKPEWKLKERFPLNKVNNTFVPRM